MSQTIATNKKAFRDYLIEEKIECGIALCGAEVKSLREGNISFKDSFARVDKQEVFLYNLHIAEYTQASYMNHDTDRSRKLLLHKKEIAKIEAKMKHQNLTLVPTKIYFNKRGYVKVELGLGKGRKMFDKREVIKKRDTGRDLRRAVKNRNQ